MLNGAGGTSGSSLLWALKKSSAIKESSLRENGTFFEFSLCLSRACLGKIMHFIYKWLKKCRFRTSSPSLDRAPLRQAHPFLSQHFPFVCPEPVLTNDRVIIQKETVVSSPHQRSCGSRRSCLLAAGSGRGASVGAGCLRHGRRSCRSRGTRDGSLHLSNIGIFEPFIYKT
jgi:hypothetical protein